MEQYDLIVAGGGLSGVAAAVAAAREGMRVLLIEKNANLGGAASNCLINPFMKYSLKKKDADGNPYYEQLNCGLFKEITDRLREAGAINESDMFAVAFNIEYMKKILEDLCEESGVELLYNTTVTAAARTATRSTTLWAASGAASTTTWATTASTRSTAT